MARRSKIPPIRVGAKITYVPEGHCSAPGRQMDFEARLLALYLDGEPVDEVTADQAAWSGRPVTANIRLSDGTEISGVPGFGVGTNHYWSRPWITSMRMTYR